MIGIGRPVLLCEARAGCRRGRFSPARVSFSALRRGVLSLPPL